MRRRPLRRRRGCQRNRGKFRFRFRFSGSGGANLEALAQAVIRGDYGNGEERRLRLGSLYDAVQARVNEILL